MFLCLKNLLIFLTITSLNIAYLTFDSSMAAENIDKVNNEKHNKISVISKINLENIEKEGFIKVVAFINGEDFTKEIPLNNLKDSPNNLKVKFEMDKENDIVTADSPDEFFVCAYHIKETNNINNASTVQEKSLKYFDCNEGDIQSISQPTQISLFKPSSQVYNKSINYYKYHEKSKVVSFTSLIDDTNKSINRSDTVKDDRYGINQENPVKVKVIVPMEDKKDATKIKVMAMLKGQIKSEIVDVQKEFDKIGKYTIERIFAFDRNTDMGPIQVGDRFHACVSGEDLNPPEGTECEKRLIKNLDRDNPLAAR
jgi:hypothetical protein